MFSGGKLRKGDKCIFYRKYYTNQRDHPRCRYLVRWWCLSAQWGAASLVSRHVWARLHWPAGRTTQMLKCRLRCSWVHPVCSLLTRLQRRWSKHNYQFTFVYIHWLFTPQNSACSTSYVQHFFYKGLHLIMHRTIGLTGYIGPLTLTLTLTLTLVRSSVSPIVRCIVKCDRSKTVEVSIMQVSPLTAVSSWLTSLRNSKGNLGSQGAEWEG